MLARQVRIDRGLFEIAMPEQDLDRAKIGAGFEKMSRQAVPQGVRIDVLVLERGAQPAGKLSTEPWS